jgi:hypothetical protein
LEADFAACGPGGLGLPDHLHRRVDADGFRAWKPSFRQSEEAPGSASDIEDCGRLRDLLSRQSENCSLDWLEDPSLHPVAVVSLCPPIESVDIVAFSHRCGS